jgi:hypothetical protein
LQRLAVGWGGTGGVSGLWLSITGALVRTGYAPVPGTDGGFARPSGRGGSWSGPCASSTGRAT